MFQSEHPLFDVLCKINLYFVGIGTIIVGVAVSLIIGGPINNIAIIIGGTIGSIISGIILIGFGEVISLLQKIKNSKYKNYNEKVSAVNTFSYE